MRDGYRKVAALDVGRARIGTAITSDRGDQALAHAVRARVGTARDVAAIVSWFHAEGVEAAVVGAPPAQGGADSHRLCRAFAAALAAAWPGPVALVDEADSTALADAELRAHGARAARRRRDVDRHAAKVILDRWLAGAPAERVAPA